MFSKRFLYHSSLLILFYIRSFANEHKEENRFPLIETTSMEVLYSDEGIVIAKMRTEKRLQYENGDSVYPAGMYVECYSKEKKLVAIFRANTVYQYAEKDVWELKGDVEVKGYQDDIETQLNTEELYWDVKNKQIYTDKFVRVETENELLTGSYLHANQDLSYYNILYPRGFVNMDSTELH